MITEKTLNKFPLSSKYELKWMQKHEMGPNSVWLTEFLLEKMNIQPGMRVLDLGCGMACSSIFLAKEKQVKVFAADLWIRPEQNMVNIIEMDAENDVFPLHTEARDLKFAHEYFDAIISIDAYQYFGSDDFYLTYLLQFLKPGGQIGVVMPGTRTEVSPEMKNYYGDLWDDEMTCFHSKDWWYNHWLKSGKVDISTSDELGNAWQYWLEWELHNEATNMINPNKGSDVAFIERDNGEYIRFIRMVASKK